MTNKQPSEHTGGYFNFFNFFILWGYKTPPTVVNKLIERIEIHNNEKKHFHNNVKVDICFTAVRLFDIPTEQQLINTMERVKQKKVEKSA